MNDEVATLVKLAISRLVDAGARVELEDPGFEDPSETFRDHWYGGGDVLHVRNLLTRIGNRSETRFK